MCILELEHNSSINVIRESHALIRFTLLPAKYSKVSRKNNDALNEQLRLNWIDRVIVLLNVSSCFVIK